jgi:signal peptidase I
MPTIRDKKASTPGPTTAPRRLKPAWRDSLESIGGAILVALTLRAFVFEAFKIPSGSMIPTLAIGDQIWVNKFVYGLRVPFTTTRIIDFATPKRGDVIVFVCPEPPHEDYIKRVVGLPGDEVAVRGGEVFINGQAVQRRSLGEEQYWDRDPSGWQKFSASAYQETLGAHSFTVLHESSPELLYYHDARPYVVPPDNVFMMGDNRDHSHDSRAWGPVPLRNIIGRSTFVWWSWGNEGLETSRLGHWID